MKARFTVAYDGAGFHGFAVNVGVRTVAGVLTEAISTVVRQRVTLTGAGRTDAGVHGWGQVITVELPGGTDLVDLSRRLNKLCAPDIAVRDAVVVGDDFDARFSALWRHYRYDVWNAVEPNPLLADRAWHVPAPLDLEAMNAAASHLVGEHDFSSFCRKPKVDVGVAEPSLVRRILLARWTPLQHAFCTATCTESVHVTPQYVRFEVRANAFCHQMVRSIVGTLVDVGTGKLAAEQLPEILRACSRAAAGQVAPPYGLTLWEVGYGVSDNPR